MDDEIAFAATAAKTQRDEEKLDEKKYATQIILTIPPTENNSQAKLHCCIVAIACASVGCAAGCSENKCRFIVIIMGIDGCERNKLALNAAIARNIQ